MCGGILGEQVMNLFYNLPRAQIMDFWQNLASCRDKKHPFENET